MRADAAPFDLPGDRRGALCIHGFTGTPFEMRHLGERLHDRGMTVLGPALPGHCTTPEDLDETTWRQWFAGVADAFDELRARCDVVAVAGQSLGALLALHLARERGDQLAAVASLSAPIWLPPVPTAAIEVLRRTPLGQYVPGIPKLGGGSDVRDPVMKMRNPGYRVIPVRAVGELADFMWVVRSDLPHIRVPTLVMHARQDHTAPHACAGVIANQLGADTVLQRSLYGSYHVITIDIERDLVAAEVGDFFETQMSLREGNRQEGKDR